MRKKEKSSAIFWVLSVLGVILVGFFNPAIYAEPNNGQYQAYPLTMSSTIKPNVMVVMDNSGSMMRFAYPNAYSEVTPYDGLFDPLANYVYNTGGLYFETTASIAGLTRGVNYWEGKFLNWLCMRRVDISKNVLIGGEYVNSGGTHLIKGYTYQDWSSEFQTAKQYDYDNSGHHEHYTHYSGELNHTPGPFFNVDIPGISSIDFYIRVKVDARPTGVIQDMGSQVRFGFATYSPEGAQDQGGKIVTPIGSGVTHTNNIVTSINDQSVFTWTPMGETLFSVWGYFKQDGTITTDGPRYHATDYDISNAWNPYYTAGGTLDCIKSYVIMISDGEATQDGQIQSYAIPPLTGDLSGTSMLFMDNVAYYAHVTDLKPTIPGTQNLTLYTISTFGGGEALLSSAAKFGGFVDSNENNLPDLRSEWDKDPLGSPGYNIPDNFFTASSAEELKTALSNALVSILGQMGSGSAISLMSTSSTGEASMIQAYFRPVRSANPSYSDETDVKWVGYLNSLWIDDEGNIREDTVHDKKLNVTEDDIIKFFTDANGNVKVNRYDASGTSPYPVTSPDPVDVSLIEPVWDAGKALADKADTSRTIYTYLDQNQDGVVGAIGVEFVDFNSAYVNSIKPYLGVASATWNYLGDTADNRASNLIQWIRGQDTGFAGTSNMRSRKIEGQIWKLGDIINSSPITVAGPHEGFDLTYGDSSYDTFAMTLSGRETMVYAGANDGMLHAFTSWYYNRVTKTYEKPTGTPGGEQIGDEVWAYIPQALLPHLKWLPSKDYSHVYYVDLTPVVFDVQIYSKTGDAKHPGGWATILIGGLNMGGKSIEADFGGTPREFKSSYYCFDITDPRHPVLLWDRTYKNLGFTTSSPAIVKVKNKWFATFGSGPTGYDGTSDQEARVFVVDVLTGDPQHPSGTTDPWLFKCTPGHNGFMNSPVAFDMGLDYSVDSVYFAENYFDSGWKSKIWKINVPWASYEEDPVKWKSAYFFETDGSITGKISLSMDKSKNVYCFFGTGRFFTNDDKANTDTQYLYGVKDPYFAVGDDDYHDAFQDDTKLTMGSLWASGTSPVAGNYGWYYPITNGERSLTRALIIGGYAIYTTFVPNQDLCGFGGDGYLYVLNYLSGQGWIERYFVGKGKPGEAAVYVRKPKTKTGGGATQARSITFMVQSSTGEILEIKPPDINVHTSYFTRWLEP